MILCPPILLSIVTIRLPLVEWRVHPKGRAPYNPHSPQQAAGCIWHAFFRIPGGGPATQTLSPDPPSTWRQHRFPLHQSSGAPVRDTTPRTRLCCLGLGFRSKWRRLLHFLATSSSSSGARPPFDIGTAMATCFPAPPPFCTGRPPCDINAVTYPNEFSTWSSSKAGTGQRALGFITCVTWYSAHPYHWA